MFVEQPSHHRRRIARDRWRDCDGRRPGPKREL